MFWASFKSYKYVFRTHVIICVIYETVDFGTIVQAAVRSSVVCSTRFKCTVLYAISGYVPRGSSRTVLGTRHALMRAASVTAVPISASNVLIYYISVYIILSYYLFSIQFHFLSYIRHPQQVSAMLQVVAHSSPIMMHAPAPELRKTQTSQRIT